MDLASLIAAARQQGASDLHLEPGLPAALRVRGSLRAAGDPVPPQLLQGFARDLLNDAQWEQFLVRRSADLSRTISGVRCRINVLHSARGVGFAIRLLASFQATVEKLNLHPDLKKLVSHQNGLVLVSGPTGCGKSTTLAALVQEINLTDSRHIVTVEAPIEYAFSPRKAYIRQREVGRDTPSFEQALLDALREDPDVLMVGEMREPETMRLTLNAAETGHLVLATVHSSTCAEALQRVVSNFAPEIQAAVASQLADCLIAVVTQRLRYKPDLRIRIPECEILTATHAVKNFVRNRDFYKIASAIETGAESGMWTFQRYQGWIENRKKWRIPDDTHEPPDSEPAEALPVSAAPAPPGPAAEPGKKADIPAAPAKSGRIEIEPVEGGWETILKKL